MNVVVARTEPPGLSRGRRRAALPEASIRYARGARDGFAAFFGAGTNPWQPYRRNSRCRRRTSPTFPRPGRAPRRPGDRRTPLGGALGGSDNAPHPLDTRPQRRARVFVVACTRPRLVRLLCGAIYVATSKRPRAAQRVPPVRVGTFLRHLSEPTRGTPQRATPNACRMITTVRSLLRGADAAVGAYISVFPERSALLPRSRADQRHSCADEHGWPWDLVWPLGAVPSMSPSSFRSTKAVVRGRRYVSNPGGVPGRCPSVTDAAAAPSCGFAYDLEQRASHGARQGSRGRQRRREVGRGARGCCSGGERE
jgi:hypothetical protein